ncbi:YesL family protein [Alkalicoccobacillus murimartini]|uniref:Membrane protein YesL n=1 Tax=Alkalicoccobacillus murimartini TaxID=171685 RepID=A0ABT9YJP9_9BACI|nr:YesL family protein [Alkalicoccobacillus murimartini]MDQ0207838.1 putative membrane protein YesL [Alkalicoccobacillus murimartini]
MDIRGPMGGLHKIAEWIMRMAYINILWVGFTLAGLVVFTIFPATFAMYAVIRKWIMGEDDVPVFKTFFSYLKKDFIRGNIIGLFLVLIGFVLYVDFQFLLTFAGEGIVAYFYYPVLFVTLIVALGTIFVFPVFVHYQLKNVQVFKTAFFLMAVNPALSILMLVALGVALYAMFSFPATVIFFGASVPAYIIMRISYAIIQMALAKQQAREEKAKTATQASGM